MFLMQSSILLKSGKTLYVKSVVSFGVLACFKAFGREHRFPTIQSTRRSRPFDIGVLACFKAFGREYRFPTIQSTRRSRPFEHTRASTPIECNCMKSACCVNMKLIANKHLVYRTEANNYLSQKLRRHSEWSRFL